MIIIKYLMRKQHTLMLSRPTAFSCCICTTSNHPRDYLLNEFCHPCSVIFTYFHTNGYDKSIALVHKKSNPNSRLYSVNHLQALPPAVLCIRCTKSKQQKSITLAQCVIMNFNFPNFYSGNLLTTIVSFGSQTFKCVPKIHLMR